MVFFFCYKFFYVCKTKKRKKSPLTHKYMKFKRLVHILILCNVTRIGQRATQIVSVLDTLFAWWRVENWEGDNKQMWWMKCWEGIEFHRKWVAKKESFRTSWHIFFYRVAISNRDEFCECFGITSRYTLWQQTAARESATAV